MVCTFIGHRDTPFSIREQLENEIVSLIHQGVHIFYVGNNGRFDYLVQATLLELAKTYEKIKFYIVLSTLNEKSLVEENKHTVFPEELAGVPKKFAISKRNDYLLKKSSFVISYVSNTFSNSYKFIQKAQKKGIKIINIVK